MENINGQILIYGTGLISKKLIRELKKRKNINLVGIIDKTRVYGQFEGVQVIEWRDIKKGAIDFIIIAAPNKYCKDIYARILKHCIAKDIRILDASGNDLTKIFGTGYFDKFNSYYVFDMNLAKKKIDNSDVVSFDIFDTLLMRKVCDPLDVFFMMENYLVTLDNKYKGFRKIRRTAEINRIDCDIYEIYEEVLKLLSIKNINKIEELVQLEIKFEEEILLIREKVYELFQYAKKVGKKIIITSDMYLPQKIMNQILRKFNICGYEQIFISCEYRISKSNGLFKAVRKNYPTEKIIHIGDNKDADIIPALSYGIDSLGVAKAMDIMEMSSFGRYLGNINSLADSLWIGEIAAHMFNSPFIKDNSLNFQIVDSIDKFSWLYIIPTLDIYIEALNKLINQEKFDNILFVARDCYLIYRCFLKMQEMEGVENGKAFYIPCSRKLAISVGVRKSQEVEFLEEIYGMNLEEVSGIDIKKSLINGDRYKKLLAEMGVDISGKNLLCELDGQGTSAYFLNNIFENRLFSFYLERLHVIDRYEIQHYSIFDIYEKNSTYSPYFNHVNYLENIFTSEKPSISGLLEDGSLKYSSENRSIDEICELGKLHDRAIKGYIEWYEERKKLNAGDLTVELVRDIFETISECIYSGECYFVNKWNLIDDMNS